jgi:hypothetical protein
LKIMADKEIIVGVKFTADLAGAEAAAAASDKLKKSAAEFISGRRMARRPNTTRKSRCPTSESGGKTAFGANAN